jgi:hypothetical protein
MPGVIRAYSGARVSADFEMNYPGIVRYAVQSHDLADAIEGLAHAGKAYAETQSPRDNASTGPHYADSWITAGYIETRVGVPPFPRGAYTLANTSDHAIDVEFGNGRDSDNGYRIFPKVIDYLRAYGRAQ